MATNIPPHNLGEVVDAVAHFLDHPDATPKELMKFVKAPDFPTGAVIMGRQGIDDMYTTGRGSVKVRAVAHIEEGTLGRSKIVVTELPYQVNKARVAEKIAELANGGRLKDVADVRDESNKEGMRLVVYTKRGANPQVVLNQLYKATQLQENFGAIMLALVDNVPRTLNLAELIGYYVDHQIDVVTRRTQYELRRAEERDHIVQGLLIALQNLDEVIKIIRGSRDADEARTKLMTKFKLSEIQANHILDMPLRRLTRLAREELEQEHKDLLATVRRLKALLKDPKKIRALIKEEMLAIKARFADARRTKMIADVGDLDVEDLIAEEPVVITVSRAGYVKRQPIENFRRQGRGGKGVRGQNLKEEDVVRDVFTTTTHHWLLFFTSRGKVYRVKVHEVPESGRTARGTYAANLPGVGITADEKVQGVIGMRLDDGDEVIALGVASEGEEMISVTHQGYGKRTPLKDYPAKGRGGKGVIGHTLTKRTGLLAGAFVGSKDQDMFVISSSGIVIRVAAADIRRVGRASQGVRTMRVEEGATVVAIAPVIAQAEDEE
jgi:DNA gyrase subunit A